MVVRFEELSAQKRAGGIETVISSLVQNLETSGVTVVRSSLHKNDIKSSIPDCVHFHGIWSPRLVKRFRAWQRQGVPCVISPHGMLEPWAMAHKKWKKKVAWWGYQKRVLENASCLHTTALSEANGLRQLGLKNQISVIPNGVDLPIIAEYSRIRSSESRVILFLSRVQKKKGLLNLVSAWGNVQRPGWIIRIVGPDEGNHLAEVKRATTHAGLINDFSFEGPLEGEAKWRAFQEAEVFILPTYSENFGIVVAESLACGTPVITTKGAPWEGLIDHECGWWTEISVEGIAGALKDATSRSREELSEMGMRGREWVKKDFAWESVAKQMVQLYESVVNSSPK